MKISCPLPGPLVSHLVSESLPCHSIPNPTGCFGVLSTCATQPRILYPRTFDWRFSAVPSVIHFHQKCRMLDSLCGPYHFNTPGFWVRLVSFARAFLLCAKASVSVVNL